MNKQEQQASPCPECGNQRYIAKDQRMEMAGYRNYDFYCTIVICGACGCTHFYASNPMDAIAKIEKDTAERQKIAHTAFQERQKEQEASQMQAQKKRGFLGL